ncbi:MAG: N-acetyltransferase [SAR324 cluster bacterium]|nr:N-acetyltransferase [SAR324 cluster bacterium]
MTHEYQKRVESETKMGPITISSFCSPDEIMSLSFNETFTKYPRYNPIITNKNTLAKVADQSDTNVTLAFNANREVVGFAFLDYSGSDERWIKVGEKVMMEVSVIEVSRPWRSLGLSKKMLTLLLDHPLKEDRIIYMVGYSWTWDLVGSSLKPMTYRNMMIALFSSNDFKTVQTNEPNILLRPENLFMVRIGANISEKIKKRFSLVRFNIDPNIDD